MQRNGSGAQRGLIFVLNNRADWNGAHVQTQWQNTRFVAQAWRGKDSAAQPQEKITRGDGWCDFWAPPRGYAVYVPQSL